jgi:dipeptidyl-peptidase 4
MNEQINDSVKPGALTVTWKDAATFEYPRDGKLYRYDVNSRSATELGVAPGGQRGQRGRGGSRVTSTGEL